MRLRISDTKSSAPSLPGEGSPRRKAAEERIRQLQSRSLQGIWGLALFSLLSLAAWRRFDFIPELPEGVRRMLGPAPPETFISIALVVYSFSALILTLSRLWSGSGSYRGWTHLLYLFAFYAFYGYGGSLGDNFPAVFVAGLTILCLEYYNLWNHCNEGIQNEKEILARLDRTS